MHKRSSRQRCWPHKEDKVRGDLEEWTELLNLWPLVVAEAEELVILAHVKLLSPKHTIDLETVRFIQGKIDGIKSLLAIPCRVVADLEKKRKGEES